MVSLVVVVLLVAILVGGSLQGEWELALAFSGSFAAGMAVLTVYMLRHFGREVLPFSGRLSAVAVLMGGCVLAVLVPQAPPLVAGGAFLFLYGLAFLILLPSHRSAVVGLLSRRGAAL